MQQEEFEMKRQLYRLVSVVLREALFDYSYAGDISVVNINGYPLVFDKHQLEALRRVRYQIEKETNS